MQVALGESGSGILPLDGRGIDQPVAMVRNGTEQFAYHQDVLGNVVLITDGSGQIAESYEKKPLD